SPFVKFLCGQNNLSVFVGSTSFGIIAISRCNWLVVQDFGDRSGNTSKNSGSRISSLYKSSVRMEVHIAGGKVYISPCFSPFAGGKVYISPCFSPCVKKSCFSVAA